MKVVLSTIRPKSSTVKGVFPPIGFLYIASYLENMGHSVDIVDAHVEELTAEEAVKKILSKNPDAVGFAASAYNRFEVIKAMSLIKELTDGQIFVFTGGGQFAKTAYDALERIPSLDLVFREESEADIARLITAKENGEDIKPIHGISYRENGKIVQTPPGMYLEDLNKLPLPAWDKIDLNKYEITLEEIENIYNDDERTKVVGVVSSRGCPNECSFCAIASLKTFRLMDPKLFVDQIQYLHEKYGIRGFDFFDDAFTTNRTHAMAVCDEIISRGLDIKWFNRTKVNTVNREILVRMKEAGCAMVGFGCESGSQRILNLIKKRITVEQIFDAVKACADVDMKCKTYWMHSHPTETLYEVKLTLDAMKKAYKMTGRSDVPLYGNFSIIYPGTTNEYYAKLEGLIPPGFSWYSGMEFAAPKFMKMDPTVPLYEQKNLTVAQILAFIYKYHEISMKNMIKKGYRNIKRVRGPNDLLSMAKNGLMYIKS